MAALAHDFDKAHSLAPLDRITSPMHPSDVASSNAVHDNLWH